MNFTKEEIEDLIFKLHDNCEGRYDLNSKDTTDIHDLLSEYANRFTIHTANELANLSLDDLIKYENKLWIYLRVTKDQLKSKRKQLTE